MRLPIARSAIRWKRGTHLKTKKRSTRGEIISGMIPPDGLQVLREVMRCPAGYVNMLMLQLRACFK